MRKYLNLCLNIIALGAAIVLATSHFHFDGLTSIFFAAIVVILGVFLGQITCHFHQRSVGFWVTLVIFVALNILHSMIDGVSLHGYDSASLAAVLSHEVARQPALYLVLWGMLAPFSLNKSIKLLIVPVVVTGAWLTGVSLGTTISLAEGFHVIAEMGVFFFIGDILHHLYEEFQKIIRPEKCCH